MQIILASASPRRKELLVKMGVKFDVISANVEEIATKKRPSAIVKELALKKAFWVAQQYPNALVIGGDTLVFCKGEILGKPKDKKDALRLLKKENDTWQSVYSGLALVCLSKKKILTGCDITRCKARKLPTKVLEELAGKHMDKAGAYAMQDKDDMFIEKIKGSPSNVIGLPCELLEKMFKEFKND